MTSNPVKDKLLDGKTSVGTFMGLGSPQVTEVLARAGLEWLIIECEHSAVDIPHVEDVLRAMNGTDTGPIVRIPSADPVWIQRSLDIGGMGILGPLVKTVEEAQAVVDATRYPPVGKRGFGPMRASDFYMNTTEYINSIDGNVLVALIVETKELVDNMEAIAAIDGVDALFMGVRDLCLSLGLDVLSAAYDTPEIDAVVEKMIAVSKESGVALGIHAFSVEELQAWQQRGFHFLSYKTEYKMLIDQVQEGLAAARG